MLSLFAWFACSTGDLSPKKDIPPLDREMFKAVLSDMHAAESLVQTQKLKREYTNDSGLPDFLAQALCIHNITIDQFTQSLAFYGADPKDFDKIYEEIISDLDKKEIKWQAIAQEEKPEAKDSAHTKVPTTPKKSLLNRNPKTMQVQIDQIKKGHSTEKHPQLTNKDK